MEWAGYKGGEIASKIATNAVKRYIYETLDKRYLNDEGIKRIINLALQFANKEVLKKAGESEELEQMGTTLEVCLIYQDKIYIGHIGDSRIYRIRNNEISRLTTDHSYVETLVEDGTITREEAFYHPKKNMLIKAIRMYR